ncbi:hypothetical protein BS50DRAFT_252221 [Corynespora cassiicola Philippines]|uniref:Uncharacterized protein n=1 Tax=Corynespora cassiicola Philippines TaxID=1448308 RepID=A0A2T2P444_CORCC|nr:hypothetical protein BS50DRAFT_252221 [Corynespora cassiicola Philippines]
MFPSDAMRARRHFNITLTAALVLISLFVWLHVHFGGEGWEMKATSEFDTSIELDLDSGTPVWYGARERFRSGEQIPLAKQVPIQQLPLEKPAPSDAHIIVDLDVGEKSQAERLLEEVAQINSLSLSRFVLTEARGFLIADPTGTAETLPASITPAVAPLPTPKVWPSPITLPEPTRRDSPHSPLSTWITIEVYETLEPIDDEEFDELLEEDGDLFDSTNKYDTSSSFQIYGASASTAGHEASVHPEQLELRGYR